MTVLSHRATRTVDQRPEVVHDRLLELAERLRTAIAATPVATGRGPLPATVSVGVAHLRADDPDLDTLLARADTALYQAKRQGRNRVASA